MRSLMLPGEVHVLVLGVDGARMATKLKDDGEHRCVTDQALEGLKAVRDGGINCGDERRQTVCLP